MPNMRETIQMCVALQQQSASAVPFLQGKPGVGKSSVCYDIAHQQGIPDDRIMVIHINNHDVVDFTGVPVVEDGMTKFAPPANFSKFKEGTGAGMIVLEELPQSSTQHQTWAAGFVLERKTSTFKLDPEVRIIVTGNRVEDKSGAKPLLAHLADRLYTIDVEATIDDWVDWAMRADVDPLGVAFLRQRPDLINDFDPNRVNNPTQRSWTKVFTEVPTSLPENLYFAACKAKVGEGAAADWTASRSIMHKMPDIDVIRQDPDKAPLPSPDEPAIQFAVTASLAVTTDIDRFEGDVAYCRRMPAEFLVRFVSDAFSRLGEDIAATKAFVDVATDYQEVWYG